MSDTDKAAPTPAPEATPAPAVTAPKKSNNSIVIVLVILLVLCLCCSAVGGIAYYVSQNAAKAVLDEAQKKINDQVTTGGSTTGGTTGGTTTGDAYSFSGNLPSGFPSDAPIYPGSKVGFSSSSNGEYSVTLTANAKVADIMAFYKSKLPSNGWTITGEQSFFGSSITAEKSGREFTVVSLGDDKEAEQGYIISVTNK